MTPNPNLSLLFSLLLIFLTLSTAKSHSAPKDLLHSSCSHASYPTLCLKTLSSYSGPANSPRDLAQAAVRVSLTRASRLSQFLSTLSVKTKKENVALSDCVEQISESVDELSQTLSELKKMRNEGVEFKWELSNAQTWVSGALTNEDTCLDGFEEVESGVKGEVKRKTGNVAKVTSNALYLINRLDDSRGEPFINGAVPYDPIYHEEWISKTARANGRNRRSMDWPKNKLRRSRLNCLDGQWSGSTSSM